MTSSTDSATDVQRFATQFQEQGWVRLGRVASQGQLEQLSSRIDAIMLGEVLYDGLPMQLDPSAVDEATGEPIEWVAGSTPGFKGATLRYRKISNLELDPVFREYMQHPLFRALAEALIGERVSVARAIFMNKPAAGGTDLGWHQDFAEPEWQLTTIPTMTLWTAIDEATIANGCLQIVPGTHQELIGKTDFLSAEEIAVHCRDEDRVYVELEPGEVVLLHSWVAHKSDPNTTGVSRRGFSFSYVDADARYAGTTPFPQILPAYVPLQNPA
jgi:hypothetical protein